MTLAENVVALQTRLADAERARARAEGARDSAQAAADNARAELQRDFGVETAAQAQSLLEQLRTDLDTLVVQISGKLDEIGV